MKSNQVIVRMTMAIVIAFGVETTAQAQFGGLLKKAKGAVEKKVTKSDDSSSESTAESTTEKTGQDASQTVTTNTIRTNRSSNNSPAKPQEKVLATMGPDEPGIVTIKNRKTGKVLATYDRAACELNITGGRTLVFQTDGTVTDGNGTKVGSIDGQMLTTPRGEQIRCDEIGIMFVDKKNVGSVQNQKLAILGDGTFIDASDKMNGVVLAYFIFGVLHSNKQLVNIKDGYEKATMTYNPTDEEFYAEANKEIEKRHGSSSSGGKGGGDMSFRRGGSIVGSMLADGTVYVGGSIKGKIDGSNNIYVGGHIEGTIRGNEILKNGHVVGTVDSDGTVRINGSIVGGIDERIGDVRKNGSIIGRVEPVSDLKKAAVFFFFGFW